MNKIKNINTNYHGTITSDLKEKNFINNDFLNLLKKTLINDDVLKKKIQRLKKKLLKL